MIIARRLLSGDIIVITDNKATRKRLEKKKGWLRAIGESVKVWRRTYIILVHRIRVDQVNTDH